MGKRLYVGSLSYTMTDGELQEVFAAHGSVERAEVGMDRETVRSRGFGFVEMSNDSEAAAAIQALNGVDVNGRALTVNEARPKMDSRGGGGGGGPRRGGGGGGRREGGYGGGGGRR